MATQAILRDTEFEELTEARVDRKHRVSLGKMLGDQVTSFRVYRNAHGQIILDPMVLVPAHDAWLFKNKRASALVQRGLEDAKRGRLITAKEDYAKYVRGES